MAEKDSLQVLADGELAGRVAVVTGAASGIGRAIALQLARAGADVLVHTRQNREHAERVRDTIRAGGGCAECLLADFSQGRSVSSLCARRGSGPRAGTFG